MSEEDLEIAVRLCDGRKPIAHPAFVRPSAGGITVIASESETHYARAVITVSPRVGTALRFVALPDGAQLECADAPWLDALTPQEQTEGPVAWLERRWWAALASVALTALALALIYFFALDAISDKIALSLPVERERSFGQKTLRSLDGGLLTPSTTDPVQQREISASLARLVANTPEGSRLTLLFRHGNALEANAFALPGGTIIVTDELVAVMHSNDEVVAVLAHEAGHVHYRHVLRQAVRSSANAAIGLLVLGDASSVAAGTTAAMTLLNTKFSRDFEQQADDYAVDLLERNQLSPELYATALERLASDRASQGVDDGYSFLASHPHTAARIARAHAVTAISSAEATH